MDGWKQLRLGRMEEANTRMDDDRHGLDGWMMTPRLGRVDDDNARMDGRSQGWDGWKKPRLGRTDRSQDSDR